MNIHSDGPQAFLGRVFGGYRLVSILGYGATGAVYLGEHVQPPHTKAAIKVLLLPWQLDENERKAFLLRFQREAQVLLSLRHPHILRLLGFGDESTVSYMILPYLAGGTLADVLDQTTDPLPFSTIQYDLGHIASALDYAHRKKVIHQDIKPSNMLFDNEGQIFLTDFSIAGFEEGFITKMTMTGQIMGTPHYMAPEQMKGARPEPTADIYSLGIVLYEMVTGRLPFDGSPIELMLKHAQEPPPSPRQFRPDLPEAAEQAILRALAKNPQERFQRAGELAEAFSQPFRRSTPLILILSDEPHFLDAMQRFLVQFGHMEAITSSISTTDRTLFTRMIIQDDTITLASTPVEIIDQALKEKPDCVVIDCRYPMQEGHLLVKLIRENERYKRIPIIMLGATLYLETGSGLLASVDRYFVKPIRLQKILDEIQKLLKYQPSDIDDADSAEQERRSSIRIIDEGDNTQPS